MMMDQEKLKDLLKKKLKEKGLKVTQQRWIVLQTLAENSDKHMTAEDVYEVVRAEHPELGLATVYRALQLLREMQLLDRINLDEGCVRYEIRDLSESDMHHHHHLICRDCGKVIPFEQDLLDALEAQIERETGFRVFDHELKFFGQCKECSERGKENS